VEIFTDNAIQFPPSAEMVTQAKAGTAVTSSGTRVGSISVPQGTITVPFWKLPLAEFALDC
jgi:hypothetical protein